MEKYSFSDVMSVFSTINTSLTFNVYLPITKKTVQFRQLTTGQEKRIAKQLLMDKSSNSFAIMPDIIQENCVTPDINIKKLPIIDFFCIILMTRLYSIDPTLKFRIPKSALKRKPTEKDDIFKGKSLPNASEDKETPVEQETKQYINAKINVQDVYNSVLENTKDFAIENIKMDNCPYEIICSIPTTEAILKKDEEDPDNISIVSERSKFISGVILTNVNTGEKKTISFEDFTADECEQLINNLPANVIKAISKYVEKAFELIGLLNIYKITIEGKETKQFLNCMSLDFFIPF